MNQNSTTTWHQTLHDDPMLVASDDDFTNFLQLGIGFAGFDETQAHHAFDTPMGDLGFDQLAMHNSLEHLHGHTGQSGDSISESGCGGVMQGYSKILAGTNSVLSVSATQHQQDQQQRERDVLPSPYQPRVMVPPTPQSSEIQGAAVRYYHFMDADGVPDFHAYQRPRDDHMTFTPLVSPAVTPIDPSLRFPEANIPGDLFSPLTSPAIEARRAHQHMSALTRGSIASPSDQVSEAPPVSSATRATRKDSRRASISGKAPGRIVRQSPLMKPQGRRKQASLNMSAAGLAELAERGQVEYSPAAEVSPKPQGPANCGDGSGQSSVSPESLSDALMPPPSIPRSVAISPSLGGKSQSPATANEPVTPATLMRLPSQESSPQTRNQGSGRIFVPNNEFMEEMMLPESAASSSTPRLTMDTFKPISDDQVLPTSSAKTPKLSAKSTPRTSTRGASVKSPTDAALRRSESRLGQLSKSRQGGTPSHVSPAIRPKISPNIKPLVPHSDPGTPSIIAETSALYLASKSNYQNILEGTHLPGVSYPEALAENLSSKRTSHKLAEQGRRNRINVALKEMEGLLPPTQTMKGKKDRSGSTEGDVSDKAAASSNSKASTVELAIAYIKDLQNELSDTRAKLEDREKKLAEVKNSSSAHCNS